MHKKKLFYLGEDRDGLSLMIHFKKNCGIQLFLFKELIPACSHKVLEKKTFKRLRKNLPYEHEGAFAGNNSLDPNFNFTGWKFLQH